MSVKHILHGMSSGWDWILRDSKVRHYQFPKTLDNTGVRRAGHRQCPRLRRRADAILAVQAWWILDEGGSNTAVGLAAGLRVVPVVLISLYAGVMIDRFGGKRVLLVERWLLVALALATALVLLSDGARIWHIVMLSTIAGATIAIGMPATQTLVPEIVPTHLRSSANLLNQLGPSAGRTIGPLLAGMLIAVRNAATAFFGLIAIYVLAVVTTMRLPTSRAGAAAPGSAIQQIADGYRYILRTPMIFWVLFLATFPIMFIGLGVPLLPAVAVEVLDTSEVQFGWMWGTVSIGMASSAILLAFPRRDQAQRARDGCERIDSWRLPRSVRPHAYLLARAGLSCLASGSAYHCGLQQS